MAAETIEPAAACRTKEGRRVRAVHWTVTPVSERHSGPLANAPIYGREMGRDGT